MYSFGILALTYWLGSHQVPQRYHRSEWVFVRRRGNVAIRAFPGFLSSTGCLLGFCTDCPSVSGSSCAFVPTDSFGAVSAGTIVSWRHGKALFGGTSKKKLSTVTALPRRPRGRGVSSDAVHATGKPRSTLLLQHSLLCHLLGLEPRHVSHELFFPRFT